MEIDKMDAVSNGFRDLKDSEPRVEKAEKVSQELIREVFQLYKPDEIMMAFNGGKDCTVVLHMLSRFIQTNPCLKAYKISTLYITDPDAFEEMDKFVSSCENIYNIILIKKKGPIKEALKEMCNENPKLKAVFMGCRRTDPYCKDLNVMQMTDSGWPQLMRINPVLDWKCRQVWEYINYYKIPYCTLYEKGYTSIGNKKNTKPNPCLAVTDETTSRIIGYKHGKELLDNDEQERAGRF